jgi:hypothetical protein
MRALLIVALFGCGQPRAWLEAERLEGTRPDWAVLRCRTTGFPSRPHYTWKLPATVHSVGGQPLDDDALLVQVADNLRGAEIVECIADDVGARLALGPGAITTARLAANQLTIDGSGLGSAGPDAAVYLVAPRGRAVRTDGACKAASWSDTRIVVCLPTLSGKAYQVRVESAGRLVLGPLVSIP